MAYLAVLFAVPLYFGGVFLLWIGITGITPPDLDVAGVWRILFGAFGGFLLAVGGWFGKGVAEALLGQRPIRRASERGELLIAPRAIRELIAGLLQRELGIKRPRVEVSDESGSLRIHIGLHLPLEEDLPGITERIRTLVNTEIERRIGIAVSSVDLTVHGIAHRGPEGERPREGGGPEEGAPS